MQDFPSAVHRRGDALKQQYAALARRLSLAGLVGATLLNGGCAPLSQLEWFNNRFKVGPNYRRPPAIMAKEWIEAQDPRVEGQTPRHGEWWLVFQDPTLSSLVYRAYQQNPNLRAVGTRVLQARAQEGIAVGSLFPQSQQATGLYPNGTLAGAPAQASLTGFNLTWELDFWGKYRRQVESAGATLDASFEDYHDALVTLLADVATNYVQFRVAQQRIKIARENLQTQERLAAVVEQQQKIGTATSVDVQQLRTLVEQTRAAIPALQIALGAANDRLCILLGEPPRDLGPEFGAGPETSGPPMPEIPPNVGVGIPADLLSWRPDVRSAERQVAAQTAKIGVAKAGLYPSLSISGMFGYADLSVAPLLASTGGYAFVVPQFTWNILNYGRVMNNIRLQDAKTQELIAIYQSEVLQAAQEVQTALRGFLRSQEQADSLANSVAAAMAATNVDERIFSEVRADVNRLFTLENTRLQLQDQLAVAQGNVALDLIHVYRALGGGWEIHLPQQDADAAPKSSQPHLEKPSADNEPEVPPTLVELERETQRIPCRRSPIVVRELPLHRFDA